MARSGETSLGDSCGTYNLLCQNEVHEFTNPDVFGIVLALQVVKDHFHQAQTVTESSSSLSKYAESLLKSTSLADISFFCLDDGSMIKAH